MRIRLSAAVAAVAAVVATGAFGVSGSDTITTIAGNGNGGFSGDGGPATRAQLYLPRGVAVDGKGNVYISDYRNRRVRKVSPNGTITTFAGGVIGDQLWTGGGPHGLAVDAEGNVYIALEFHEVLKVAPGGTITTIAGTRVVCIDPLDKCLGDGGPATSASLIDPEGVAVDRQGNIYLAESAIHRVRKVSAGGTITTIAGTGKGGFSGDGGPATRAQLRNPYGIAVDGKGNVYISDSGNHRVRKVSRGGKITTFAGTGKFGFSGDGGPATSARLSSPRGLAVDGKGDVYISGSALVRKVSPAGTISTIAGGRTTPGLGDGGPATSAGLTSPDGVAVDGKGNVYIADVGSNRVRKVMAGAQSAALKLTLTLGGASPQPLLVQKAITVMARCNRPCSLAATGSVTIVGTRNVFGLTRTTGNLRTAGSTRLTLRFSAAEQRRFGRLLKPGQRAQAKITVRATDAAGRTSTATRTVAVRSSSSPGSSSGSAAELRAFVDRVEGVLVQSASGRRELGRAIAAGFNCSITARAAGQRVDRVVANRQSLLRQLRALQAPTRQTAEALGLLRLGLQHSIEADIRYRDGFFGVGSSGCPLPPNRNFTLARQSDVRASAAKQRFVAVFNPLARSVGRRTWSANEI